MKILKVSRLKALKAPFAESEFHGIKEGEILNKKIKTIDPAGKLKNYICYFKSILYLCNGF
jgi:hypothetical protein